MTDTLHAGRFLKLVKDGKWEFAQRTTGKEVVAILGLTDAPGPLFRSERKILLVEQYRIPVGCNVLELPAGITGDTSDATLEATARRELLEETGYEAGALKVLMSGPSSSGLTDEHITIFQATELKKTGKGGGVKGENITVHEVPLLSLDRWLESARARGVMVDFKIYAALYAVK
jgi:ADP-ribose pyrophosphatase